MPKISVIIAVYNVEKYLRQCLDSVVNQTLKDIEIICIDDGSTDGSAQILKEYAQKDNKIKLITQENQGLACSRNNALKIATGEYILCVDSDDYIRQDTLEKLYQKAKENDLDMLSFGGTNFDNETRENLGNPYYEFRYLPKDFNIDCFNYNDCTDFITKMAVSSCLTMYKHSFLKSHDIVFPPHLCFEDNVFFCKALMNAQRCGILKDTLYFRRIHSQSITQNWAKNHLDFVKVAGLVLDYLKSINVLNEIYEKYRIAYSDTVINNYNHFQNKYRKIYYKAIKSFAKKYSPDYIKKINKPDSISKYIFSARNEDIRKVITILGIKFKFKSKKLIERKKVANLENNVKSLIDKIGKQETLSQNQNDCIKNLTKQINEHKNQLQNQERQHRYELCKYMHPDMYPVYLKDWYKKTTGETLNLENPQTFNEKIQWLKLYDSTPLKTRLADKYLVRDWVKEKIGEEYLIPLLGVWDNFDEIDFDKLPNQFVLKCNHGCGYNIIVNDKSKFNKEDARRKINNWMNEDFAFRCGLELHYSAIPRKIIAEKYLDEISNSLYDYRFFCTKGECVQIWLDIYSGTPQHKRKIYDKNWNELDIIVKWPRLEDAVEKPSKLSEMLQMAEYMSKEFALVRVDFYFVKGTIYFGEMTFTSMSGTGKFEPEIEGLKLGQMIKLPINKKEYVNC